MADTPAMAIDIAFATQNGVALVALGDGTVKDPLDRLVVLLQRWLEET